MKRCRRPFTLVEMLISIGLMALILSTLTYFFRQVNLLNSATEKMHQESFKLRNLEMRLNDIIPKAVPPKAEDHLFYTAVGAESLFLPGSPSLIFTYDNGVNLVDADFSNHVLGRLFLDKAGNLSLASWPSYTRWEPNKQIPIMREVLIPDVESLDFAFFIPPEHSKKTGNGANGVQNEEPEPKGAWVSEWKQEYHSLPALVKIQIKIKGPEGIVERTMVFPLIHNGQTIVYEK